MPTTDYASTIEYHMCRFYALVKLSHTRGRELSHAKI
jgi:hypothetical protein